MHATRLAKIRARARARTNTNTNTGDVRNGTRERTHHSTRRHVRARTNAPLARVLQLFVGGDGDHVVLMERAVLGAALECDHLRVRSARYWRARPTQGHALPMGRGARAERASKP